MDTYPTAENESERVDSLERLNVLYTPREERFDRITRIAAKSLDVKYAMINLVDKNREWAKSQFGLNDPETSREHSFCARTMYHNRGITIIPDASQHEVFSCFPNVTGPPHIRFYMSRRLTTPGGEPAGALCVYDDEPRETSEESIEILKDLASCTESELRRELMTEAQKELIDELDKANRRAAMDQLTRAWNKQKIKELLQRELARAHREDQSISLSMLDLDRFKNINDKYGHPVGDRVLQTVSRRIRKVIRPYDALGRYGGEEFLMVLVNADLEEGNRITERIRTSLAETPIQTGKDEITVTGSFGLIASEEGGKHEADNLIERADQLLYRAKEKGRNRVVSDVM